MRPEDYDEIVTAATVDRDLAILSTGILRGVVALAGIRRAALEADSAPSPDLDLFIVIEERATAELARRRGIAA